MLESPPDERGLLAALAQYGKDAYVDISDLVNENCFSEHINRYIFVSIDSIFKEDNNAILDTARILAKAKSIGIDGELSKSIKYITALFNYHVELNSAREFAVKLRKLEEFRQLLGRLDDTAKTVKDFSGDESISEAVSVIEKPIFDFTAKLMCGNEQVKQIGEGIDNYYQHIINNEGNLDGVSIGFPIYEKHIGGLKNGLHIISARKKTGKSFLALNGSLYCSAKTKTPVLYLDTELHLEQGQWDRFIARLGNGLTIDEISSGSFLQEEEKVRKFERSISILKKLPLQYVNVTGRSIHEVMSIMRRWLIQTVGYNNKGKLNKCLIVYDYLKPPNDPHRNIREHEEMGSRVDALHEFTSKYNVPILTFCQLNRELDIAIADRISWFCTSRCNFYAKTQDEINEDGPQNGNRKLILEDLRFGEGLDYGDYINFAFDGKRSIIKELGTRNQAIKEKEMCKDED